MLMLYYLLLVDIGRREDFDRILKIVYLIVIL